MLARFQYAFVLAALIVLRGLALPQIGQTNSIEQMLRLGHDQLTAKEWTAAEATFRQALQSEPENPRAHEGLGQSLYELGRWTNAIASFKQTLKLAPTNSVIRYRLGRCYYRLGGFQRAAAYFRRFVTANPADADGHYWLSRSLCSWQLYAEAEAAVRKAIALGSAPARYYDQWGYCLEALSRNGEAIAAYKKALSLEPDDACALLRLGACYYETDAYREAVAPLEKYVKAHTNDFYGYYYLGHSYLEIGQFDQAARSLQAAHELNPNDSFTRVGLLLSYLATAQLEKAYGLYPLVYTAAGGVLAFCYVIGLAWLLVKSFKMRPGLAEVATASEPAPACALPPLLIDCQAAPPVLPGFIVSERLAAQDSRPPVIAPKGDRSQAWPGIWFSLAWMALFFAGQVPCAFLLGLFASSRGVAALLVSMGAAGLPLLLAAGAAFPRKPWGAPFGWPRPFPPAKLLGLSLLGLVGVGLFTAGYSQLIEWITHKPFPVQIALSYIREAVRTNPISVVVSVVFLAPMAEEVLFRGLLFGTVRRWLSPRWTIVLTASVWSLIHMQAIYFAPIFLVGLLCGWARHKSGSVALPMGLHILNNGAALLLLLLFPQST